MPVPSTLLLVQKREELRILLGANKGMVKIVVPAAIPAVPVAPRTVLNLTLAAILGLMAGRTASALVAAQGARSVGCAFIAQR